MSSAAVVAMASEPPAGQPRVHPLFTTPRAGEQKNDTADSKKETEAEAIQGVTTDSNGLLEPVGTPGSAPDEEAAGQVRQPNKRPLGGSGDDVQPQNAEPRRRGRPPKKRKSSPGAVGIESLFVRQNGGGPTTVAPQSPSGQDSAEGSDKAVLPAEPSTPQPPKRILRLNPKTGTIGSPPKAKEARAVEAKRGKKPKDGQALTVKYGQEDEAARIRIGVLIDSVLADKCRVCARQAAPEASAKAKPKPKKSTHPFFTGGLAKTPAADASAASKASTEPPKHYTSTPVSPKWSRAVQTSGFRMPQFGVKNGTLRVPGACLPAWPAKDAMHVRPAEEEMPLFKKAELPFRKRKGHVVEICEEESIVTRTLEGLHLAAVREEMGQASADGFAPAAAGLRLPQKTVQSGRKLQGRVAKELQGAHGGLERLFAAVETTLSAFDRYECESASWGQKYAPTCAAEVLQCGREPQMMKEWLAALKVVSVDTGASSETKSTSGSGGVGKKKRKKNKLEGFVVSSDEEEDEMGEVSDGEAADWSASGGATAGKKTVIRAGDLADKGGREGARLTNAIVVSGPQGCGKTAAVYAVAKELGFEVFEINASSRRSGKDVLDRIGDMTRNHLVQHRRPEADSFFQRGAAKTAKTAKPAAQQKQSLILLEEVDILYEEDRQFWATVVGLMTQSKRPFVMTCNDERLVPLGSLRLHGIFRFGHAPVAATVDRLVLVAACEGHVVRRAAVEALVEARGQDMRAALAELQFWCQMGLGDRRGGFDWYVPRWPEGVDRDEEQQVVRVTSEGTYEEGMGWLGGREEEEAEEEELVEKAWTEWQLDMGQWQDSLGLGERAGRLATPQTRRERVQQLAAYEQFADAMADADVLSSGAFATGLQTRLDATLPEMASKARDDYITGLALLEQTTAAAHESDRLRRPLATAVRCAAKRLLASSLPELELGRAAVEESEVVAGIRRQQTSGGRYVPSGAPVIVRSDHSAAFDPIATDSSAFGLSPSPSSSLDPSVFDRTMEMLVVDVAPYVRGIVAYDGRLQRQRQRRSRFLSESTETDSDSTAVTDIGDRPVKRMRTTRAALSALEGGPRSATRRERWFQADINPLLVLRTGGEGWAEIAAAAVAEEAAAAAQTAEAVLPPMPPDEPASVGLRGRNVVLSSPGRE